MKNPLIALPYCAVIPETDGETTLGDCFDQRVASTTGILKNRQDLLSYKSPPRKGVVVDLCPVVYDASIREIFTAFSTTSDSRIDARKIGITPAQLCSLCTLNGDFPNRCEFLSIVVFEEELFAAQTYFHTGTEWTRRLILLSLEDDFIWKRKERTVRVVLPRIQI